MTQFEINIQRVQELKGNYQLKSPYHKNKMLPFNVLGTVSFDDDFPIEVYTVEYRGRTKIDHYGKYRYEVVKDFIDSGYITKTT